MTIEIIDEQNFLSMEQKQLVQELIQLMMARLDIHWSSEVDISIVDNEVIQSINADYRGIDKPTDVLSFPLYDANALASLKEEETITAPIHFGDIIISFPKVIEQAENYGHSVDRELGFLLVHGFLHLNGYDHETEEERLQMFKIQDEILDEYGLKRDED